MLFIWILLFSTDIYAQKNITIGMTNILDNLEHSRGLVATHLNNSQCYNSTRYSINIVPFNTVPVYESPIGKNNIIPIQMIFGPDLFYGPKFYGFQERKDLFKFPTKHVTLFNMPVDLRQRIISSVVNEVLGSEPNKTLIIIINGSSIDLMKPWEALSTSVLILDFKGVLRVMRYSKESDAELIASQIKSDDIYNIAIDLNWSGTSNVLRACNSRDLLSWRYKWMVFFSSFPSLFATSGLNIPYSRNFTVYDFGKSCDSQINDLIKLEDEMDTVLSDIAYTAVRLMDFQNCNRTLNEVVELATGNIRFTEQGELFRENWILEIYRNVDKFKVVGRIVVDSAGNIKINQPVIPQKSFSRNEILIEMRSQPFRIVAVIESPFVNVVNGSLNSTHPGFTIEIMTEILTKLRVTYEIRLLNISTGILNGNKFTGALNYVQSGQADIAIGPISYNPKYLNYIDFTREILPYKLAIIYKEFNINVINNMFQFIDVFEWKVWLLIVSSCFVYAIGLTILNLLSPNRAQFGFVDSVLFTLGSQVQGVTTALPDKISGRVLVVFWWIFNLIIVLTYVANYGALRTNARLQATIQTLEDLTKQSAYTYSTLRESSVDDFLASSSFQYIQQISRLIRSEFNQYFVNSTQEALSFVREKKHAFIYHDVVLEPFKSEKCLVITSGFEHFFYAFALAKNSDYTSIINEQISELYSGPSYNTISLKYNTTQKVSQCLPSDWLGNIFEFLSREFVINSVDSLRIQQIAGIFVIMLFGIILAVLLAIVEIIYRFIVNKRKGKGDDKP